MDGLVPGSSARANAVLPRIPSDRVVVAESVFGVVCPLTTWEHDLRTLAGSGSHDKSFMEYWVHRIIFFDLEPETFTLIYGVFFLALVLSFVFIPPRWRGRRTPQLGRND